jgi:hypothetical protein
MVYTYPRHRDADVLPAYMARQEEPGFDRAQAQMRQKAVPALLGLLSEPLRSREEVQDCSAFISRCTRKERQRTRRRLLETLLSIADDMTCMTLDPAPGALEALADEIRRAVIELGMLEDERV